MMRLASILSTVMVSAISPMYIISHGIRASVPLLIALVLGIIWTVVAE